MSWARIAHRCGWRAYAILVLSALTVLVALKADPAARAIASSTATPHPVSAVTSPAKPPTPTVPKLGLAAASADGRDAPTKPQLPAQATALSPCLSNAAAQFVLVDISAQYAWMCAGKQEVNATAVTTGDTAAGDATPVGSWHVQAKLTDQYLTGPDYSDFVQFWVPFNGDFGFHDASWQTMPFGSSLYQTRGSHGCVHLPTPVMAWFYSWIHVGSLVTVQS